MLDTLMKLFERLVGFLVYRSLTIPTYFFMYFIWLFPVLAVFDHRLQSLDVTRTTGELMSGNLPYGIIGLYALIITSILWMLESLWYKHTLCDVKPFAEFLLIYRTMTLTIACLMIAVLGTATTGTWVGVKIASALLLLGKPVLGLEYMALGVANRSAGYEKYWDFRFEEMETTTFWSWKLPYLDLFRKRAINLKRYGKLERERISVRPF